MTPGVPLSFVITPDLGRFAPLSERAHCHSCRNRRKSLAHQAVRSHYCALQTGDQPGEVAMVAVPKKVSDRLIAGIKTFQPILNAAPERGLGEADTVTIVKDMLADVFGYDKYAEVTSEHAIRGTYCDLAIKI